MTLLTRERVVELPCPFCCLLSLVLSRCALGFDQSGGIVHGQVTEFVGLGA